MLTGWKSGFHLVAIREPAQRERARDATPASAITQRALGSHRGLPARAWFYRDQRQLEADLIVQLPNGLLAIEIKSAATVFQSPFDNLKRRGEVWQAGSEERPRIALVYGGDDEQKRSEGEIVSWRRLQRLLEQG